MELARPDESNCKPADTTSAITVGEDVTGIDDVTADKGNATIYNLLGCKVEKVTMPGIYIVNGKKIFVK